MAKKAKKLDLQIDENMVKSTEGLEYINTPPKSGPLLTFDHWFMHSGRKNHHKVAMKVYASTIGRKTKEDWDSIFSKY